MNEQPENNYRILIVDDQYGIRVLLTEILQGKGYETFEAANGTQALSTVETEHPHLVLLDMKIPGMDGLEILKQIKKEAGDTKVMMMTAYGETDMIEQAMANGAITYFDKPFEIDEVLAEIEKVLPING